MKPTKVDPQCYIKHANGRLVLAMTAHVDCLKITGVESEITSVLKGLEEAFDTLKLERDNFEHLGLKHALHDDDSPSVNQNHYVAELRPIAEAELKQMDPDAQFQSLLGGVAWVSQTRPDAAVFISALQRTLKSPKVRDALNLNRILKYLKLRPV